MILIFGGAHQGKLDYAKTVCHLSENEIFTCTGTAVDFSKRCIRSIEELTFACSQASIDPVAYFRENRERWKDSVLICRDISGGVVPMEAELRAWRQENGRLCRYLAEEAEQVIRIYCGLGQRLK